jgi:hypothetical protein
MHSNFHEVKMLYIAYSGSSKSKCGARCEARGGGGLRPPASPQKKEEKKKKTRAKKAIQAKNRGTSIKKKKKIRTKKTTQAKNKRPTEGSSLFLFF